MKLIEESKDLSKLKPTLLAAGVPSKYINLTWDGVATDTISELEMWISSWELNTPTNEGLILACPKFPQDVSANVIAMLSKTIRVNGLYVRYQYVPSLWVELEKGSSLSYNETSVNDLITKATDCHFLILDSMNIATTNLSAINAFLSIIHKMTSSGNKGLIVTLGDSLMNLTRVVQSRDSILGYSVLEILTKIESSCKAVLCQAKE